MGASIINYCYDGDQVIAEYDGSGTLLRKYIYGPGIDEPVCMIDANGNRYYYTYDGLGSVTALWHNGTVKTVVERYSYTPFGQTTVCDAAGNPKTSNVSDFGNRFMFTGREYDDETNLYYYRARMYSPALSRFMQPDPIGYADSMNLYQYCGNNPINFIDPWGLEGNSGSICSEEDTQKYLRQAVDASSGMFGFLIFTGGTYDPKISRRDEYFTLNGEIISASEFGNYMAGYACYYNYGQFGKMGVQAAGDIYALADNILKFIMLKGLPDEWYWWLDDMGSQHWIRRGFRDAERDILDAIFGHGFYDSYFKDMRERKRKYVDKMIEATYLKK